MRERRVEVTIDENEPNRIRCRKGRQHSALKHRRTPRAARMARSRARLARARARARARAQLARGLTHTHTHTLKTKKKKKKKKKKIFFFFFFFFLECRLGSFSSMVTSTRRSRTVSNRCRPASSSAASLRPGLIRTHIESFSWTGRRLPGADFHGPQHRPFRRCILLLLSRRQDF